MNIAAIYDKYDLWGKVRVSRYDNSGAPMFVKNLSIWLISIKDKVYRRVQSRYGIKGMMESALENYLECEHCEGDGVVPSEPYTTSGNIPDCDTVRCKHCNGTGERA